MTRIEYLYDQALRAERLASNSLDALTVDRLTAFAAECRAELQRTNIEAIGHESAQAQTRHQ
jgi:hypothetical protein